jgi:nicotinamide mononucleotide transporter
MHWLNHLLTQFYNAQWHVTKTQAIYYREIVGNVFGLASALYGLRRNVLAWPVGVIGNVLLFTVFMGQALGNHQGTPLFGQAARQVFFVIASVYGWWRWQQNRRSGRDAPAVTPRWATASERSVYLPAAVALVAACALIFTKIGYGYDVAWWYYICDAWIFVGSMLATYAMARGWVDFWLCWIAVDLVGVPELLHAHYYPSAIMYAIYAAFVIWGFFVWLRISRNEAPQGLADPEMEVVA